MMNNRLQVTPNKIIILLLSLHCFLLIINRTKYFNLVGTFYIYFFIIPFFALSSQRYFSKIQIIILVIILLSLGSYFMKGGSQILAVLLFWIVTFFIVGFETSYANYLTVKRMYCISSCIMSILLLIQHRHPYTGSDAARYGLYYSSQEFYDVNFTATFFTIPTVLIFIDIYDKKLRYRKLATVALILNLLAIYFLGSRSGLVIVFCSLLAYAIISKNKRFGFKIIYVVSGALILLFVLQFLPEDIMSRVVSKGIIDGKSSTRYISWMYGIEAFKRNPIWGNGVYSTVEMIRRQNYWGNSFTAHNTYISYLAMYGIVGSIPILIFLLAPIYNAIKYKYELYFLILYVGFLVQLVVIEAGFSEIMLTPIILFWMYINSHDDKKSLNLCN